MKLKIGDKVMYEHSAVMGKDMPEVTISFLKVKELIFDELKFVDEDGVVRDNAKKLKGILNGD